MLRLAIFALAGFAGLFAVGCSSSNQPAAATGEISDKAVACDKCKTTWVSVPHYQSGSPSRAVVAYTQGKSHECPDCRSAVENFFATGNLAHDCKSCGPDALKVCDKH